MKQRAHWLALSLLVVASASPALAQPRRRIRTVRAPSIGAVTPAAAPVAARPATAPTFVVPVSALGAAQTANLACTDTGTQSCGVGACMVTVPRCQNGRALQCQPDMNRRVPETCDGVDNDCDGVVDNAPNSGVARSVCPAPAACTPLRAVSLTPGVTEWRLADAAANPCAAPFSVAGASSHEEVTVQVATRTAVVLSTTEGGAQLFGANRGAVLETVDGLCAMGTRTGAAILEPGTYVLRATGDGAGARTVRVEAAAVPARASQVVASSQRVTMSTATGEQAPFDCRASDGVDVRVLVCPRGRSALLSSPQGFLASLEGASGGRTCYPVGAQQAQTAPLPAGSLVVVRAWPSGPERGPAFVDVR